MPPHDPGNLMLEIQSTCAKLSRLTRDLDRALTKERLEEQLRAVDPPRGQPVPVSGLENWKKQKVCCIGLCKTGTKSFGTSLSFKLDYIVDSAFWPVVTDYTSDLEGEIKDSVDHVLESNDAFSDYPWMFLYEYVYNECPDMKFVLSLRDSPQRYAASEIAWHEKDGNVPPSEESLINIYNEHNTRVREFFSDKPGKLLEMCFEEGDAWNKLGVFLNLPSEVQTLIQKDPMFHTNRTHTPVIGDDN